MKRERWLKMNPNRLRINVQLSKVEIITVLREEVIK
jgi:hypothetical protein